MESINLFSSSPYFGLPVNSQLTTQMLQNLGYRVLYWEPIGLRKISLIKDFKKIANRLKPNVQVRDPSLKIISTLALPPTWGQDGIQGILLKKQHSETKINFVFLPSFEPLISEIKGKIVYFVVDKYSENPGANGNQIRNWERNILKKAFCVITTSQSLMMEYQEFHKDVRYWPNVCKKVEPLQQGKLYHQIKEIPGRKFITWGNISQYKMNLDLLEKYAQKNPTINFILIGDQGIGEVDFKLRKFSSNVHVFPKTSYGELLSIGKDLADVLVLWNRSVGSGKYSFPMKLPEYMWCEKPILLERSPAIPHVQGLFYFDHIGENLETCLENKKVKYDFEEYTYESRLEKLKGLLHEIS